MRIPILFFWSFLRLVLLPALVLSLVVASPVGASESVGVGSVRLQSGRTLSIHDYVFLPEGLRIEQHVGGGVAKIRLAYRRLDPASVDVLLKARAAGKPAAERMRLAARALDAGIPLTSASLYMSCLTEAAYATEANTGLARARRAVVTFTLNALAQGLAEGADRAPIRAAAYGLATGPHASALTQAERVRLAALTRLAGAAPVAVATPAPAVVVGPPAGAVAPVLVPGDFLAPLRAELVVAKALRNRAADPTMPATTVISFLERAATSLRNVRSSISTLPAKAQSEHAKALDAQATALLTSNLVDLADLHRQAGRFQSARDHVRSALLLTPEDAAALQQRALIESDVVQALAAAAAAAASPYDVWGSHGRGFETYWIGGLRGSYFRNPYATYPYRRVRGSTTHRRVVGRRR